MAKELLIRGIKCISLFGKELATYTPWSMAIKINQKEFVFSSKDAGVLLQLAAPKEYPGGYIEVC